MIREEIQLKLLLNRPIPILKKVDDKNSRIIGKLQMPTINEVIDLGYMKYMFFISLLRLPYALLSQIGLDMSTPKYDCMVKLCESPEIVKNYEFILSLLFKEKVVYFSSQKQFSIGELEKLNFIDPDIFNEISLILDLGHTFNSDEKKDWNPADEIARQIIEKIEKGKAKLRKEKKDSDIRFVDIISSISARSWNLSINQIGTLSLYQAYDQLVRLQIIDQYDLALRALAAGAKSKDVKFRHWLTNAEQIEQ